MLRYISDDINIFKMVAVCHLEFLKSSILVTWPVSERDYFYTPDFALIGQ